MVNIGVLLVLSINAVWINVDFAKSPELNKSIFVFLYFSGGFLDLFQKS